MCCQRSAEQGRERRWDLLYPIHAPRHHPNHQGALFLTLEIPEATLRAVSIDSLFPRLTIFTIYSRGSGYLSPPLHLPSLPSSLPYSHFLYRLRSEAWKTLTLYHIWWRVVLHLQAGFFASLAICGLELNSMTRGSLFSPGAG